jgi:hypothetical protein
MSYNQKKYALSFNKSVRKENNKTNNNIDINIPISVKLNNSLSSAKYSYSNIIDFLSYMNNTICINDNVRIVCHSHIMNHFLKNIEINKKNKNVESILKENLWSIFLNTVYNKKITISRHGFTFANLIKEKDKSLYGKIEQGLESDTKLSIYGILTALIHGLDLVRKEIDNGMNSPNNIFVSILIRTWMTAICLYLPYCIENDFTLIVSPFIKEEGSSYDNQPEKVEVQIENLASFLNFLIIISEIKFTNTIINTNLLNIKSFFESKKSLTIYTVEENYVSSTYFKKAVFKLNSNNKIEYNISNSENYFNKKCNNEIKMSNLEINNIKLFHGEIKPSEQNIKTKFTRWCEPFSKKGRTNSNNMCKKRLSEKGIYENIIEINSEENNINN